MCIQPLYNEYVLDTALYNAIQGIHLINLDLFFPNISTLVRTVIELFMEEVSKHVQKKNSYRFFFEKSISFTESELSESEMELLLHFDIYRRGKKEPSARGSLVCTLLFCNDRKTFRSGILTGIHLDSIIFY